MLAQNRTAVIKIGCLFMLCNYWTMSLQSYSDLHLVTLGNIQNSNMPIILKQVSQYMYIVTSHTVKKEMLLTEEGGHAFCRLPEMILLYGL